MHTKRSIFLTMALLGGLSPIGLGSAHAATIANPSFENPAGYTGGVGYMSQNGGAGSIPGWTASNASQQGINTATMPFASNDTIPAGVQVGFIQTNANTNTFSNTITGLTAGQVYQLSFRTNARNGQVPTMGVAVGGTTLVGGRVGAVADFDPYHYVVRNFTATGPTMPIVISSTSAIDQTLLIDDFQVNAPGAWSINAWNGDATSGISSSLTYTHAYNFNSAASPVINGVTFTGITGANPFAANFSLTGSNGGANDAANNVTGSSATMAANFVHGGGDGHNILTLTGLISGRTYRTSIFGVAWNDVNNLDRVSTFQANGDRLTVNEEELGTDNGIRLDYEFVASGTSQVFTYDPLQTATFHTYGFANAVIPEPSACALIVLALGGLASRRRR